MKKFTLIFGLLLAMAMTMQAEIVYNGEAHNVASWNAKQLPVATYSMLTKATQGDVIAITVSAVDNTESKQGRITLQSLGYKSMGEYDEYNISVGVYYFVLTKAAADSLKTKGMNVTGENYSFNKVELLYQKSLWEGPLVGNADWVQSDNLQSNPSRFADLQAGDLLGIEYSNLTDDHDGQHACVLRINYRSNIIDEWVSKAGTYIHTLSADDVDSLQNQSNDIHLVARWLTINTLNTYVPNKSVDPTAINQTNAIFDNRRYDIFGRPVDENYRGVVILNGKKYLQ